MAKQLPRRNGEESEEVTNETTQITHVAIKFNNKVYQLPPPNRHHDIIRLIASENGVGINGPDVQGFVDEDGEFLTRKQAFALACVNGQLKRRTDPGTYQGNELYSEDLW